MRRFRGIAALILVIALVGALGGCKKVDAVARVNGEDITRAEFDRIYQQVIDQMGGEVDESTAADYKKQLLSMMIDSKIITQKAEELGADLSPEAVDAQMPDMVGGDPTDEEFIAQVEAAGLTIDDLRTSVRDEIARQYVSEQASSESSVTVLPETYSLLSHILVDEESVAKDLYTQIEAGGDFAALASANSTDTASAVDGGSLGWSPTSAYVTEFAAAADALAVGEVSEPVKSNYGWHIIKKLDEMKEGDLIADAPEELQAILSAESSDLVLQEYVGKLREAADIEYLDETLAPTE